MKTYARIASKFWCQPLMLSDHTIAAFSGVLQSRLAQTFTPAPRAQEVATTARQLNKVTAPRGTAIVAVDGVIDKHIPLMDLECYGGCDLDDVDAALRAADADPAIQNILLVLDTPGGSCIGTPETAALVADIATRKNLFAYTDSQCCSAGYYIASQADQIFCSPSAMVGSIGVRLLMIDESEALAKEGIKITAIDSGKFKTSGASFRPLSEEEYAMFAAQKDQLFAMFRSAVLNKREVGDDAMQGQVFFGAKALEAGLVDAILPSIFDALAQF